MKVRVDGGRATLQFAKSTLDTRKRQASNKENLGRLGLHLGHLSGGGRREHH